MEQTTGSAGCQHAFNDEELVEFRCMIQDIIGSEIYQNPQGSLSDRTAFYCINIPGENDWVRHHPRQVNKNTFMINDKPDNFPIDKDDRNQRVGFSLVNKSYPVPNGINSACLIKIYDSKLAEQYRVNDTVFVTGFLEKSEQQQQQQEDQSGSNTKPNNEAGDQRQPDLDFEPSSDFPYRLVPRVHVSKIRSLAHINPLLPEPILPDYVLSKTDLLLARARLSTILTQLFGGDSLASEYLIMSLISGVYKRKDVTTLGQMTLGLTGFKTEMKFLIDKIAQIVAKITTHSHYIDLSIANLNNLSFTPKKDHENNKMIAGSLQLPSGLYLILNETALSEGNLNAQGTENVAALADIITWQRHNYNFQFHRVEIETDLKMLVFSEGKSLLPVTYSVRLEKNDDETVALMKQACESVDDFLTEELLNMLRCYITSLKDAKNYNIPDKVQRSIEGDFVEWRKQPGLNGGPSFTADDLSSYLSLARLLAISRGELELNLELWKELCDMEFKRQSRLALK